MLVDAKMDGELKEVTLRAGDSYRIRPGVRHRMTTSIGRDDLVKFLESTGHIPKIERLSGGASTRP